MLDLSAFGLDAKTLSTQSAFKPSSSTGKILLFDGDGACYESAAGAAKHSTAMSRFERAILQTMYLAKCDKARVHLTPNGCHKNGRHLLLGAKKYQDNRGAAKKPQHLEYLRSAASMEYFKDHPDIEIILNYTVEADDALMTDHYYYKNGILVSPDKDLNISPFMSYIPEEGVFRSLPEGDYFGWIDRKYWNTPSGKVCSKMVGKGTKFFWAQMMMGDTADNVKGIIKWHGKLCGESLAYDVLNPITDEHEAANVILDAYKAIDQNPIPEAEAMWLLRNETDSAFKYISSLELTNSNLDYLHECYYNRKWRLDESDLEYQDAY